LSEDRRGKRKGEHMRENYVWENGWESESEDSMGRREKQQRGGEGGKERKKNAEEQERGREGNRQMVRTQTENEEEERNCDEEGEASEQKQRGALEKKVSEEK